MTKKDYEVLAKVMRDSRVEYSAAPQQTIVTEQWERTLGELVKALQKDNPNFKPNKFRKACGQ